MLADLKKLKLKLKEEMTAIESDFEPDGIIWRLGNHGKPKILWRRSGSIRTRPTPVGPPDGGGPRCGLPPNRHRLKSSWYDYAARLPACVPASDRSAYRRRSEEHTSELQSLIRISYAVFCLKNQ